MAWCTQTPGTEAPTATCTRQLRWHSAKTAATDTCMWSRQQQSQTLVCNRDNSAADTGNYAVEATVELHSLCWHVDSRTPSHSTPVHCRAVTICIQLGHSQHGSTWSLCAKQGTLVVAGTVNTLVAPDSLAKPPRTTALKLSNATSVNSVDQ